MDTCTIAWIGAITGIIGMLTGGFALAWDIYKWNTSRAKMKARIYWQIQTDEGGEVPVGEYYRIEIINRSDKETTIMSMTLLHYKNRWDMMRRKGVTHFLPSPVAVIPATIGPNEPWNAYFPRGEYFSRLALNGFLYWRIQHSASDKPVSVRIHS
jgi:hypothetical protein